MRGGGPEKSHTMPSVPETNIRGAAGLEATKKVLSEPRTTDPKIHAADPQQRGGAAGLAEKLVSGAPGEPQAARGSPAALGARAKVPERAATTAERPTAGPPSQGLGGGRSADNRNPSGDKGSKPSSATAGAKPNEGFTRLRESLPAASEFRSSVEREFRSTASNYKESKSEMSELRSEFSSTRSEMLSSATSQPAHGMQFYSFFLNGNRLKIYYM
jgi:hypothetical protein